MCGGIRSDTSIFRPTAKKISQGLDYYGVTLILDWETHDAEVFVNGILKTPIFDYKTDVDDVLELKSGLILNDRVEIFVVKAQEIEPVWSLDLSGWVFDGITLVFPLIDEETGNPVAPERDVDVSLSLDGVWLEPTRDFFVTGTNITFTDPPGADSRCFGQARGAVIV